MGREEEDEEGERGKGGRNSYICKTVPWKIIILKNGKNPSPNPVPKNCWANKYHK